MSFDRRYFSRQTVLDGFGPEAQRRLAGSHVFIAGLGGTGSVAALNLALAGVGRMSLLDRDVVSVENLHRQPIYTRAEVGMSKAEVTSRFLGERGPGVKVEYTTESLERSNARRLLGDACVALDCLDNMEARHALNEACVKLGVPLVHTGAIGWEVSVAVFWSPENACLDCLIPGDLVQEQPSPSCEEVGVLGAITSYAASVGSIEAVKLLAGIPSSLIGRMLYFDARSGESRILQIEKRDSCGVCGSRRAAPTAVTAAASARRAAQLCGADEFYVSRAFPARAFGALSRKFRGEAVAMGASIILLKRGREEVSLFRSGGALVKGASSAERAGAILRNLGVGT